MDHAETGNDSAATVSAEPLEAAQAVASRAGRSAVEAQQRAVNIHRRAADLHRRAAEFYSFHAKLDRLAEYKGLASQMDIRAEHERVLEAEELRRAEL
jgi:hypothetical protein